MKAGLYKRISTGEQSKYSLEAQEEQLKEYCDIMGYSVYKVYEDIKGRFTFEERNGLMNLLDDIEKNKIDVLLVTELDRLAGEEGIIWHLRYILRQKGVKLISINEENKVKNEYEELIESILSAVAKFENKRKKLRCMRGIKKARAEGRALSRAPFGYKYINIGKANSRLIPEEETKDIVIDIFQRYIVKGDSMYRIAKDYSISKSTIRYILTNKFYYDEAYNGIHEPLITKEVYKEAYDRLNKS